MGRKSDRRSDYRVNTKEGTGNLAPCRRLGGHGSGFLRNGPGASSQAMRDIRERPPWGIYVTTD